MNATASGPTPRPFLGVVKSVNGVAWRHRLGERQENAALTMHQAGGIPEIVARILAGRGVAPEDAARFLDPTIRDLLPDPLTLTDMAPAAERLADAVRRSERIAIFGDYDVDGASSSALIARFLRFYGLACEIYIPDRIFEGYGPNVEAMRDLATRASLIVTVDCGTNSQAAIAAAREAGADVVVLDHHQQAGELPPSVPVVNPNRVDDLSGQGHLAAAGVVFLVLVQAARLLREERGAPDLLGYTDLVALATVCDVVPLVGVNRAFVAKGLIAARRLENAGLAALARAARVGEPLALNHFGFILGPRINAGGRIGDAALGSRLLATDDPAEAAAIAERLDGLNRDRQAIETAMLAEARAEAEAELAAGDGPAILVTASERWHPGVVGLLASRMKEQARRPAFAIAFNADGTGTGSGRSVAGFDLGRLVRAAVERGLLKKGGGHAMAAGITVERAKLGPLRAFFEEEAAAAVAALRSDASLAIDAAVSAEGVTFDLLDAVEKAGPYGQGHPQPVFAIPRHRIAQVRLAGTGHLRVDLRSESGGRVQAMAFRVADTPLGGFLEANRERPVHVAGTLGVNHWNGAQTMQFSILDASPAE